MKTARKVKGTRTTIGLSRELRRKLVELAARRGEKGFSSIVTEALEAYFRATEDDARRREDLLALEGSITEEEADELLKAVQRAQEWK